MRRASLESLLSVAPAVPVVSALTRALRWSGRVVSGAFERALEPRSEGPARLDGNAFAGHVIRSVRERLGQRTPVLATLPTACLPRGDRPFVLHLIDSVGMGGSQKIIFDLLRGLGDRWDMEVVARDVDTRLHFGDAPLRVAASSAALEALGRGRRPDVLHVHYWGNASWIGAALDAVLAGHPGVPVLMNMNSPAPMWEHPAVSHVAYVSAYLRAYAPTARPSSIVYPGVDVATFRPREAARGVALEGQGLGVGAAGDETVGLVYRLESDKLGADTIEVLIALARMRPRARIVIVGEGRHFDHFVRRTWASGVRGRFHFAGLVSYEDLPAVYDRFTLFLAPVHTESYGLVVPYAMAKGIPVCGYRVGALEEIVGHADGLVETPEALAALASRALAEPARRAALAAGSRERVMERFSLRAMLEAYDAQYNELVME